jgi:rhamnose transport system substrate-binding protein
MCALAVICGGALFAGGKAATGPNDVHAIVFKSAENAFGGKLMDGFEAAITEQGGQAIRRTPDLPTVESQSRIIDQLITEKVASITLSANDFNALQPVLTKAKAAGIGIVTVDSAVNPAGRSLHVNQTDTRLIGETLVEAAYDVMGGSGDFAILSSTSHAPNQNAWIAAMEQTLMQPRYAGLNLVKIAYGDDLYDRSLSEAETLLDTYPGLKAIVSPTTIGIAAAAQVVTERRLIGKIDVTGLGFPSEMAEYIDNGSCPYMFLWSPVDLGYLAGYAAKAIADGKITGADGDGFSGGRLGDYTVILAGDGGTEVILGPPFKFEPSNINEWKDVY